MKRLSVLCSIALLIIPCGSRAAVPVFFGEIAWAGSSASAADEWFELCGPAGTDLSDWTVDGAATGNGTLRLPVGSIIPSDGAFLVSNYGADDPKSTLAIAPQFVTTSVALSNSALFLTLRDKDGAAVDAAGASGTAPFSGGSGSIKASMERLFPLKEGGMPEAWASATASAGFDVGATELGTPGTCPIQEHVVPVIPETTADQDASGTAPVAQEASAPPTAPDAPAPTDTPHTETTDTTTTTAAVDAHAVPSVPEASVTAAPVSAVRISEAYPSPNAGEREWIELVDPSGNGEVLGGWTIEDGSGAVTKLSGTLLPWSRVLVTSPKGSLNNDGDMIVLRDGSGRAIDGVTYGKWTSSGYPNVGEVRKGESLIRLEWQDTFAVTTTPTPGAANILTARTQKSAADEDPVSKPAPSVTAGAEMRKASAPEAVPAAAPPQAIRQDAPTLLKNVEDAPIRKPNIKKAAAKKPSAQRYKGRGYLAEVASPPDVYSKTRLFALIDGALREVRLTKAPEAKMTARTRIAFIGREKRDGDDAYLLANPGSIRVLDASASATFAQVETWPERAGTYRFDAEVVSKQAGVLAVRLGKVEGDVLAPSALTASLKNGDIVSVDGYVAPGARPRTVLGHTGALTLFKAFQMPITVKAQAAKLPWPAAAGLTLLAAGIGGYSYLRHERLKRLALVLSPVDAEEAL